LAAGRGCSDTPRTSECPGDGPSLSPWQTPCLWGKPVARCPSLAARGFNLCWAGLLRACRKKQAGGGRPTAGWAVALHRGPALCWENRLGGCAAHLLARPAGELVSPNRSVGAGELRRLVFLGTCWGAGPGRCGKGLSMRRLNPGACQWGPAPWSEVEEGFSPWRFASLVDQHPTTGATAPAPLAWWRFTWRPLKKAFGLAGDNLAWGEKSPSFFF